MDEAVYTWAITAVDHQGDRSQADAWFAAIHASYTEPEPAGDYAEFTERLLARGAGAGVDEAVIRQFVEDLERYESAPMDVVQELADKHDTLADNYVELRAQAAAPAGEDDAEAADAAEAAEALWNWDESMSEWSHYEDGEWVPQRSWDGTQWLVLNQEKTDWVAQRTWDGTHWYVMNEDRSEWVLEPGQAPPQQEEIPQDELQQDELEQEPVLQDEQQEPVLQEPVLQEQPGQEQPPPPEPVPAAEAVVATEVMAAALDEAMLEIPGLDGLSEDEIRAAMERALASELKVS